MFLAENGGSYEQQKHSVGYRSKGRNNKEINYCHVDECVWLIRNEYENPFYMILYRIDNL